MVNISQMQARIENTLAGVHRCGICENLKPLTEFFKDKKGTDGFGGRCKSCHTIYKRNYYRANRDQENARTRASHQKHRVKRSAENRARHVINPIPKMLHNAKWRAKRKGLQFDLRPEDITVPLTCPVLNIPLVLTPKRITDSTPSLDRIDSTKGYVRGNVMVISFKANMIKSNATVEDLRMVLSFYERLA